MYPVVLNTAVCVTLKGQTCVSSFVIVKRGWVFFPLCVSVLNLFPVKENVRIALRILQEFLAKKKVSAWDIDYTWEGTHNPVLDSRD